jgi:hypothetical protein
MIPNSRKIKQHLPWQYSPEFTQIGIFWLENMPSGIPADKRRDEENLCRCDGRLKEFFLH